MLLEVRIDRLIPHMHSIIQVNVGQLSDENLIIYLVFFAVDVMRNPAH